MPDGQIEDKERRQKFKEYYDNLGDEWSFIDEKVRDIIFKSITQQTGERLEEFIDTFKMLITYTNKDNKEFLKMHRPDKKVNKHPKIKRGMHISLIIQPKYNPSKYCYIMKLYFTYKKMIYDLKFGKIILQ